MAHEKYRSAAVSGVEIHTWITQSRKVHERKNKVKKTVGLSFAFLLNLAYCLSSSDGQKSFLLEKVGNQNKQTWKKKSETIFYSDWIQLCLCFIPIPGVKTSPDPPKWIFLNLQRFVFRLYLFIWCFQPPLPPTPPSAAIQWHTLKWKYGIKLILINNSNDFYTNHKGKEGLCHLPCAFGDGP